MPTLIRLIIMLLFLAGLVYAGMFALVAFVEPTPKEVTIRIPSRDLLGGGAPGLPGAATTTDEPASATPAEAPSAEPAVPAATTEPTTAPEPLTD